MTERAMQEQPLWLVYSREHNAFWRPNAAGYTVHIDSAGRYTKDTADMHCGGRDFCDPDNPPEVAVMAPEAADRLDELEAECKAASLAMEELEAMFPGWEGYRSLADCIAVRMHDLADGTPIAKHKP